MSAFDIVGYDFKGGRYCTGCIKAVMPTAEGEAYEGWADATGAMGAEEFLQGIADAFGIDRVVERSFDTSEFPKVIFRGHVHGVEVCDMCGGEL